MFRSERLNYYKVVAPVDSAREVMIKMGSVGGLHLIDLNKHELSVKRPFHAQIHRIHEVLSNLTSLEQILGQNEKRIYLRGQSKIQDFNSALAHIVAIGGGESRFFDGLADEIGEKVRFLREQNNAKATLEERMRNTEEELLVLRVLNLRLPEGFK